jgi:Uncharacterized Zn-finger containing protein
MTDDDVKKISRFLENGGTMLANHCDTCGAPLFRFKGEIICPLCSGAETDSTPKPVSKDKMPVMRSPGVPAKKTDTPQKYEKSQKKKIAAGTPTENMTDFTVESSIYSVEEERLRELILMKLSVVAEEMQNETDPRRIFESLEIIEKGLDLIERLY